MATDGWIFSGAAPAWSLIMFEAVNARYDSFGGLMAAAALAGALGGIVFGRFIDRSEGGRAAWISAAVAGTIIAPNASCGAAPIAVIGVALGATMVDGLYVPALMTAVYHEAQASPCPLRFQVAAESGWDIGGILACLSAAALCSLSAPLQLIIVLALPALALQGYLLAESYLARCVGKSQPLRR